MPLFHCIYIAQNPACALAMFNHQRRVADAASSRTSASAPHRTCCRRFTSLLGPRQRYMYNIKAAWEAKAVIKLGIDIDLEKLLIQRLARCFRQYPYFPTSQQVLSHRLNNTGNLTQVQGPFIQDPQNGLPLVIKRHYYSLHRDDRSKVRLT